jgi:hypothetical protein
MCVQYLFSAQCNVKVLISFPPATPHPQTQISKKLVEPLLTVSGS